MHWVFFLAFILVSTKFGLERGSICVYLGERAEKILQGVSAWVFGNRKDDSELECETHTEAKGKKQELEREGRISRIAWEYGSLDQEDTVAQSRFQRSKEKWHSTPGIKVLALVESKHKSISPQDKDFKTTGRQWALKSERPRSKASFHHLGALGCSSQGCRGFQCKARSIVWQTVGPWGMLAPSPATASTAFPQPCTM